MIADAKIRVFQSPTEVARAASELIVESAASAIQTRRCFHFCLSGGSTPKPTYSLLAATDREKIRWSQVRIYFGDERCVPPDHPDSNYKMASDTFLTSVPILPNQVHRIPAELDAPTAALQYEQAIRSVRFDLVLLGLGTDSHTASLFPNSEALLACDRLCIPIHLSQPGTDRITLTFPVFNRSRRILFLVTGPEKAEALRSIHDDPIDIPRRPAQGIRSINGDVIWLVDREAASALQKNTV